MKKEKQGKYKFKVLAGSHSGKGKAPVVYNKGESFYSDERLDKRFKNKFKLLNVTAEDAGADDDIEVDDEDEVPLAPVKNKIQAAKRADEASVEVEVSDVEEEEEAVEEEEEEVAPKKKKKK